MSHAEDEFVEHSSEASDESEDEIPEGDEDGVISKIGSVVFECVSRDVNAENIDKDLHQPDVSEPVELEAILDSKICCICEVAAKYRCPSCNKRTCSAKCCQEHKK